jgi:hypothetical protein
LEIIMTKRLISSEVATLLFRRIREIEESPCAYLISTRRSTAELVDRMWDIIHKIEAKGSTIDATEAINTLAMLGSTAPEWAERTAASEAYSIISNLAHC